METAELSVGDWVVVRWRPDAPSGDTTIAADMVGVVRGRLGGDLVIDLPTGLGRLPARCVEAIDPHTFPQQGDVVREPGGAVGLVLSASPLMLYIDWRCLGPGLDGGYPYPRHGEGLRVDNSCRSRRLAEHVGLGRRVA